MSEIDPLNTSLNFLPQAEQSRELAKKRKNALAAKPRRGLFSSMLEKSKNSGAGETLEIPPEVALLPYEKAIETLKDTLDAAGDTLKDAPTADNFAAYKKAIKNFVSYVSQKNYELEEHTVSMMVREHGVRTKKEKRLVLIKTLDEKLDRLAQDVLFNHADKLKLLEKIEEIHGIVIDLLR
jgi:uncharacterized protein YaaR (DUF327 family)